MQNINWQLTLINTISANTGLIFFLSVVWLVIWFVSAWHCLNKLAGIDRLTWLVALIGIPLLGLVFYWMKGADENRVDLRGIDSL